MADPQNELLASLQSLGFTSVEALVYRELAHTPGQTGYRLAHAIGKSQGNTYQALNGLVQKGAVLSSAGETKLYTAVPAAELLSTLRRRFERTCETVDSALCELQRPPAETVIARLESREQVLERARWMLGEAKETAVFEAFPASFEILKPHIADAVARLGPACAGLVMLDPKLSPDANVGVSRRARVLLDSLDYDHFALAVDANSFLFAQFEKQDLRVRQAIWMNDSVLCGFLHSALVSDVILHRSELLDAVGSPNLHLLGRFPSTLAYMAPPDID